MGKTLSLKRWGNKGRPTDSLSRTRCLVSGESGTWEYLHGLANHSRSPCTERVLTLRERALP
jgi:hypothetical protein